MQDLQKIIVDAFERAEITPRNVEPQIKDAVMAVIDLLDMGELRVAERTDGQNWITHQWHKKAVLLSFRLEDNAFIKGGYTNYYDKVPSKFARLHARVLRSPHAHAEIVAIDASEARALPGVVAVVTARDVPGLNRYGRSLKDQRVLCDDRVRQIGDPVAAVAAETAAIAAQALARIRVEYRVLPAVFDPEQALAAQAPRLHDEGNVLSDRKKAWGDAEAALATADVVLDETFSTPFCEHAYLEPEAVLAYLDEDARLVVRSANQHPALHRAAVAETMLQLFWSPLAPC